MSDLGLFTLHIVPSHYDEVPVWLGRAGQAWFLGSASRVSLALGNALHDGSELRPFTLGNLEGGRPLGRGLMGLHPSDALSLRLTTLHADVTRLVERALIAQWMADGIVLHDQPLRVARFDRSTTTFRDLAARWLDHPDAAPRAVTLEFRSPTAFKRKVGTEKSLPVAHPHADLVFGSLANRWTAFGGPPFPPGLAEAIRTLSENVERGYKTQVSFERANRGYVIGFVGRAHVALAVDDPLLRAWLNVLADFAPYGGVGVKTTVGLGRVDVER